MHADGKRRTGSSWNRIRTTRCSVHYRDRDRGNGRSMICHRRDYRRRYDCTIISRVTDGPPSRFPGARFRFVLSFSQRAFFVALTRSTRRSIGRQNSFISFDLKIAGVPCPSSWHRNIVPRTRGQRSRFATNLLYCATLFLELATVP